MEIAPEELDPMEREAREDASRNSDHIHRFTGKSAMKDMADKLCLSYVLVCVLIIAFFLFVDIYLFVILVAISSS